MTTLTITDPNIKLAIDNIAKMIDNTYFKGRVYLCDNTLASALLGTPIYYIQILVDMVKGAESFANWLALQLDCLEIGTNPIVDEEIDAAMLMSDDILYEITSTESIKSRGAKVSLETAVGAKFFTYQTLLYNLTTQELSDPLGCGGIDIRERKMRAVDNADRLLADNPSLMITLLKDASSYHFGITADLWMSLIKNAHLLQTLNVSRFKGDLMTILVSDNAGVAIERMYNCGLLRVMFPLLDESIGNTIQIDQMVRAIDLVKPTVSGRLSAMYYPLSESKRFSTVTQAVDAITKDLRGVVASQTVLDNVAAAIRNYSYLEGQPITVNDAKIKRFFAKVGTSQDTVFNLMEAYYAIKYGDGKTGQIDYVKQRYQELQSQADNKIQLPINGNDIMKAFNIPRGTHIGVCLGKVREFVKDHPQATKEQCLDVAESALTQIDKTT